MTMGLGKVDIFRIREKMPLGEIASEYAINHLANRIRELEYLTRKLKKEEERS